MGSVPALKRYTERMVQEMDKMKCHATPARTESDQGYHNYLYDTGELAKLPGVRVTHHEQGHGIVNTIGAMNGFRVPKHMKGPLDTHWKIKDKDGWILDYNGERSAVVHRAGPVPLGARRATSTGSRTTARCWRRPKPPGLCGPTFFLFPRRRAWHTIRRELRLVCHASFGGANFLRRHSAAAAEAYIER